MEKMEAHEVPGRNAIISPPLKKGGPMFSTEKKGGEFLILPMGERRKT